MDNEGIQTKVGNWPCSFTSSFFSWPSVSGVFSIWPTISQGENLASVHPEIPDFRMDISWRPAQKSVSGFTVYSHQETPGLGGEIEKNWFQKNFEGKTILDDQGNFVSVTIAKGAVKGQIPESRQKNFVDGISGATMTGKFLSGGLKETLNQYEPLSERFRKNEIKWTRLIKLFMRNHHIQIIRFLASQTRT